MLDSSDWISNTSSFASPRLRLGRHQTCFQNGDATVERETEHNGPRDPKRPILGQLAHRIDEGVDSVEKILGEADGDLTFTDWHARSVPRSRFLCKRKSF